MSEYTNGFNVNINEVVRLTFVDQSPTGQKIVHELCMPYDLLKGMYDTLGRAITDHDAKIAEASQQRLKVN